MIVDQIVALTDPDLIYLFGSRARTISTGQRSGPVHRRPDPVGNHRRRENELRRLFPGSSLAVDPWIMGRLEFEETRNIVGGLAYPATHEGRLVYARP